MSQYDPLMAHSTTSPPIMKRREVDSFSTASGISRASREKPKSSRFSLRRLFRYPSSRSVKSVRSASELETRSVSSFHTSAQHERDNATQSNTSTDEIWMRTNGRGTMECPLCLSQQHPSQFPPVMTCHHRSCRECLRQYLKIEIMESRVNIACPECAERFHPNDIAHILDNTSLMSKYEEFMLRRILVSEPDVRWCPAPDCGYAVIATGCASCPKLKCERPGCGTYFCYHCKQYWHPNVTCDTARAERASSNMRSSVSYSHENNQQAKGDIKPCPRCGAFIIKMDDGSCNHMTCAVCGAEFCWLCMQEISDLHYLSPSGCTFWGKKPWSRKKKILWQLGTLVGAPVGIGLVAGIAVPAMVIGIPVWVGRKIHAKYEHANKHKRNLLITGGVTASVLVSPILAGLAVGIGVPILLAYVYGVVPISLCRSGGCGVSTTNSRGVKLEFDDDNEVTVGVSGPYSAGDAQSVVSGTRHVTNPSIGPSIGEMSIGMTNSLSASGSHMDRAGVLRDESDRDSASNRALVGTSLSGSLCGSAVAGPSGLYNRLEVQADVNTGHSNKRASLSSESANFSLDAKSAYSLDAKSATVSFSDDASTKALAGSICNRDKDNNSAIVPPLEVHVDVISSTVQYHRGGSVESTDNGQSKTSGSHGSPTSSRSVNFATTTDDSTTRRSKRYKHQNSNVGDRIYENGERVADRNAERLSMKSFTGDDASMDIVCEHSSIRQGACGGSRGARESVSRDVSEYSMSLDSVTSHHDDVTGPRCASRASGGSITEVESDYPCNSLQHRCSPVVYIVNPTKTDAATCGDESSSDTLTISHDDSTLSSYSTITPLNYVPSNAGGKTKVHVHSSSGKSSTFNR